MSAECNWKNLAAVLSAYLLVGAVVVAGLLRFF